VPEPPVMSGDWAARSGYEIGQKLATMDDVTAVFCGNDNIALGLVRALTEHGRRVPEDISVVGFDDVPDAGYFLPPLTTVQQDFLELGRRALSALVERISGAGEVGRCIRVAPELVPRASTAAPPDAIMRQVGK
jgi:DNA-binding LacI/PurR family transcriptional regulator